MISGTITAVQGTVVAPVQGFGAVAVQITGTWTGTLQFEATVDGSTWTAITGFDLAGSAGVSSTTANGLWVVNSGGLAKVRARASALASGTAVVSLEGTANVSGAQTAASLASLNAGYMAQLDWYVDPVNGSDTAAGTIGAPLKTVTELYRRLLPTGLQLSPGASSAAFTFNVTSNPVNDRPVGRMRVGFGCTLDWNAAAPTTNYTGAITAVTAAATPSSNTSCDLTDSNLVNNWVNYPGQRIRVPSGPRAGAVVFPLHDLTAKKTRTAKAIIPDPNVISQISKLPTLAVADPIVVESLMQVDSLPMDYDIDDSADTTFVAKVRFNNFQFNKYEMPTNKTQYGLGFYGCIFATATASSAGAGAGSSANFFGCLFRQKVVSAPGSNIWLVACCLEAGLTVTPGSTVIIDGDTCADGPSTNDSIENTGGYLQIARASSYNSITIPGFRCWGNTVVSGTGLFGSTACYGSGNLNVGMHCRSGHTVLYGAKPTVTGLNNDCVVGKQASQTWASFAANGALDALTNAAIVLI